MTKSNCIFMAALILKTPTPVLTKKRELVCRLLVKPLKTISIEPFSPAGSCVVETSEYFKFILFRKACRNDFVYISGAAVNNSLVQNARVFRGAMRQAV